MRTLAAVALGFLAGLSIGPVSVFGFFARHVWRNDEAWPEWEPRLFAGALLFSIPAAINGAIGAALAARSGSRSRRAVVLLPALLHMTVGVVVSAVEPQSFVGFQLYALLWSAVIWSAGRIGQRIGWGLFARNR